MWGLYTVIRRSPKRWWFYTWLLTLPIMAAVVFAAPVIIDPLFNRFEPLAKTNPELTAQLQSLAHSAGLEIPESRIFLMHASDKLTTYNAYVTGFGATKRIVVWDTTARDLTLPQTLFVFGHEMGHYVLHHIYLGLAFGALLLFAGLWLTQRIAQAALARYGAAWQIRSIGDWSSLPLLMLLASVLSFLGEPLGNAFSRWEEHAADVYGLSVTRPVTKDAGQVAAQAFQVLGEKSYSYPEPFAPTGLLELFAPANLRTNRICPLECLRQRPSQTIGGQAEAPGRAYGSLELRPTQSPEMNACPRYPQQSVSRRLPSAPIRTWKRPCTLPHPRCCATFERTTRRASTFF